MATERFSKKRKLKKCPRCQYPLDAHVVIGEKFDNAPNIPCILSKTLLRDFGGNSFLGGK